MSETAILAGGCFWGMEDLFKQLPGVIDTEVGYTGGVLTDPTYNDIKKGDTGHAEALKIVFYPLVLSYRGVLEFFFKIHDPTTPNRQGNDRGSQYRSLICYLDEGQKATAIDVIELVNKSGKWPGKVVTEVAKAGEFYGAEAYHQDYLQKNPGGYTCHYARPDWEL